MACVEAGVYGGRSLLAVALALRDCDGGYALGIDPYSLDAATEGETDPEHLRWWRDGSGLPEAMQACEEAIVRHGLSRWCGLLRSPFEAAINVVNCNLSLVHVDGNHTAAVAMRDVRAAVSGLAHRGVLVLDDTDGDRWPGVQPARKWVAARMKLMHRAETWEAYTRE